MVRGRIFFKHRGQANKLFTPFALQALEARWPSRCLSGHSTRTVAAVDPELKSFRRWPDFAACANWQIASTPSLISRPPPRPKRHLQLQWDYTASKGFRLFECYRSQGCATSRVRKRWSGPQRSPAVGRTTHNRNPNVRSLQRPTEPSTGGHLELIGLANHAL